MKTINTGISSTNASPALQSSCWPDYVEESFERLIATVTAIASVVESTTGSDL